MNTLTSQHQAKGPKGTISAIGIKVSIIALLVLFTFVSAFAGDKTAPDFKGSENFRRTFPQATAVEFQVKDNFTVVNFTWNGLKLQSFYDRQGNALGTSRQITLGELPLVHMVNISSQYPGYELTEAIEFDHPTDGMYYYVTVAGAKKSYVLQITADGTISVFKKMKH